MTGRMAGMMAAAAAAVAAAALCVRGGAEAGGAEAVSGSEGLRELLRQTQRLVLPREEADVYDGGEVFFVPRDGDAVPLPPGAAWGAVTVFEDALTRETVFLDADGAELGCLAPVPGYDPGWVCRSLCPGGVPGEADAAAYDPSLVALRVTLVPPPAAAGGAGRGGGAPSPAARLAAPSSEGARGGPGSAVSGGEAVPEKGGAGAGAGEKGGPGTNTVLRGEVPSVPGRTVYVDGAAGNDVWGGREARARGDGAGGPKRTVAAGTSALRRGDSLVVAGGAYAESLDVRGRDVSVRFRGGVTLLAAGAARARGPAARPPVEALTGTVSRAEQRL